MTKQRQTPPAILNVLLRVFVSTKKVGFIVSCSGGINLVHSRGDVKVRITLKIILMGNRAN